VLDDPDIVMAETKCTLYKGTKTADSPAVERPAVWRSLSTANSTKITSHQPWSNVNTGHDPRMSDWGRIGNGVQTGRS
jgi:hypothetical protein